MIDTTPRPERMPRLLLVEDDPRAAFLMIETLREQFGPDCVTQCERVKDALAADVDRLDLVLTDMKLPDGTGLELLEGLRARRPDLPVVLVTGEGILENALAAIRQGAYDYVVKAGDYLFAIPLVVEKNLALYRIKQENLRLHDELERSLTELQSKNHQLEEAVSQLAAAAATDPLTGLTNRRAFSEAMEQCFADAVRQGDELACVMIDLDGFKQLNDTLGHRRGDQMLQNAARVLQEVCRKSDVAGRYGGDEFVLLLPHTNETTAAAAAKRISEAFIRQTKSQLAEAGFEGTLTMSMGLATLGWTEATHPEQLLEQADQALYSAKQAGKTRLMIYRPRTFRVDQNIPPPAGSLAPSKSPDWSRHGDTSLSSEAGICLHVGT